MSNSYRVFPSKLNGTLKTPPSKSHTLRAILFASLAEGESRIEEFLPSPDADAMMDAVRQIGADVHVEGNCLRIRGCGGRLKTADDVIQCGNSGIVLRFIGALAGLLQSYTVLTGDASIRHSRPVKPLLEGLKQLGAFAESSRGDGFAPILIRGPLTKTSTSIDGTDSQPVSGLLIAAALSPNPIEIHVKNPGEKPWIDVTLDWFKRLGIRCAHKDYSYYRMEGNAKLKGFSYKVPGDFSTAAFPIAAALITNSKLTLENIDMSDVQGDKAIIPVFEKMGARFAIDERAKTLTVQKGASLKGLKIDVNDFIDALPILAVVACFAEGETQIVNASIARNKESDRIGAIARELKKMGAQIEERPDGLVIRKSTLKGAELHTYHDHRIVLSLSVAALAANSPSTIFGVDCAAKTYPNFYADFRSIGASLQQM